MFLETDEQITMAILREGCSSRGYSSRSEVTNRVVFGLITWCAGLGKSSREFVYIYIYIYIYKMVCQRSGKNALPVISSRSPTIKLQILLFCFHTFLTEVVRRISFNINRI